VLAQLASHGLIGRVGVLPGDLDHVEEHSAALHVRQELVPQPGPLRRSLDQAGDVRKHQLTILGLEGAEHRLDRGERVVGHLRGRARQPSQERGLAGVGQAHEPRVGKELQPQLDPARFALESLLGEPGSLPRGTGEPLVSVPPRPSGRRHRPLPGPGQVVAAPIEALDLGARRHRHLLVLAAAPVLLLAPAVPAASGSVMTRPVQGREVAPRRVAHQHHVASAPAVPSVRASARNVGLAPEADAAVPSAPPLDVDLRLVVEHALTIAGVPWPSALP
jgi:hypothetical protein